MLGEAEADDIVRQTRGTALGLLVDGEYVKNTLFRKPAAMSYFSCSALGIGSRLEGPTFLYFSADSIPISPLDYPAIRDIE